MRNILLLLALIFQGLLVHATTITVRKSSASPLEKSVLARALVPLLVVEVKASGKQFPPPVSLVIQGWGYSPFLDTSPISDVYLGQSEKLISWGPFPLVNFGQTVVGPIHLSEDVWTPVFISARFADDISSFLGSGVGVEVVGVAVDGYMTEISDIVEFEGNFPIKSEWSPITSVQKSEALTIINTTPDIEIQLDVETRAALAYFDFVAEAGDVMISDLFVGFELANGDARILKNIALVNEKGETLANMGERHDGEGISSAGVLYRGINLIIPEGVNHWYLTGDVSFQDLDAPAILHANVPFFGEAWGMKTAHYIVPTIVAGGDGIRLAGPLPFVGSFCQDLTLGDQGKDVIWLQRILNFSPDTQIVIDGADSPGNETGVFGESTKSAVQKLQEKYGLPSTGFVGPLTRAMLNGHDFGHTIDSRISWIGFMDDSTDPNRLILNMSGTIKPNTAYAVQASRDLETWETIGQVNKTDSTVLKEPAVAVMDKSDYEKNYYFRLVELVEAEPFPEFTPEPGPAPESIVTPVVETVCRINPFPTSPVQPCWEIEVKGEGLGGEIVAYISDANGAWMWMMRLYASENAFRFTVPTLSEGVYKFWVVSGTTASEPQDILIGSPTLIESVPPAIEIIDLPQPDPTVAVTIPIEEAQPVNVDYIPINGELICIICLPKAWSLELTVIWGSLVKLVVIGNQTPDYTAHPTSGTELEEVLKPAWVNGGQCLSFIVPSDDARHGIPWLKTYRKTELLKN